MFEHTKQKRSNVIVYIIFYSSPAAAPSPPAPVQQLQQPEPDHPCQLDLGGLAWVTVSSLLL